MARIAEVEISNILGIKHAAFRPSTVTVVSGQNGVGKSSLLDGLKQVFAGGHDPTLLRRGAKLGEAVLTLDDGTTIRMRVSQRGTTYDITDATGQEVKAPRAFIDELGDCLAVDPARLLLAKPKDLAGILLEIMPITFTRAELQEAVGEEAWAVNCDMTLEQVEQLGKQIYETRATANRQEKQAEATVYSLRSALPEGDETDWARRVAELRDLLDEARRSRESEIAGIERSGRDRIEEIKARAQREIEEARREEREAREKKDAEFAPDLRKIEAALQQAELRKTDKDRAEGIRRSLAEFESTAKKAHAEARNFTAALEAIGELKQRKLSALPITGIEVRDGQVYCDGVPFERVNLSERIKIAFSIAAVRSGKLPFMVLDQAEAFDEETWQAFRAGAQESGFQVLAARVSSGPLTIEAADGVQASLLSTV